MKYGVYTMTDRRVTMNAYEKLGGNFDKHQEWTKVAETRTVKEAKQMIKELGGTMIIK